MEEKEKGIDSFRLKIEEKPKKKPPFYLMTLEDDKGGFRYIKIYKNSNPSEIAFNFCKTNNLDFNFMKYIKKNIKTIIKNFDLLNKPDKDKIISNNKIFKSSLNNKNKEEQFEKNNNNKNIIQEEKKEKSEKSYIGRNGNEILEESDETGVPVLTRKGTENNIVESLKNYFEKDYEITGNNSIQMKNNTNKKEIMVQNDDDSKKENKENNNLGKEFIQMDLKEEISDLFRKYTENIRNLKKVKTIQNFQKIPEKLIKVKQNLKNNNKSINLRRKIAEKMLKLAKNRKKMKNNQTLQFSNKQINEIKDENNFENKTIKTETFHRPHERYRLVSDSNIEKYKNSKMPLYDFTNLLPFKNMNKQNQTIATNFQSSLDYTNSLFDKTITINDSYLNKIVKIDNNKKLNGKNNIITPNNTSYGNSNNYFNLSQRKIRKNPVKRSNKINNIFYPDSKLTKSYKKFRRHFESNNKNIEQNKKYFSPYFKNTIHENLNLSNSSNDYANMKSRTISNNRNDKRLFTTKAKHYFFNNYFNLNDLKHHKTSYNEMFIDDKISKKIPPNYFNNEKGNKNFEKKIVNLVVNKNMNSIDNLSKKKSSDFTTRNHTNSKYCLSKANCKYNLIPNNIYLNNTANLVNSKNFFKMRSTKNRTEKLNNIFNYSDYSLNKKIYNNIEKHSKIFQFNQLVPNFTIKPHKLKRNYYPLNKEYLGNKLFNCKNYFNENKLNDYYINSYISPDNPGTVLTQNNINNFENHSYNKDAFKNRLNRNLDNSKINQINERSLYYTPINNNCKIYSELDNSNSGSQINCNLFNIYSNTCDARKIYLSENNESNNISNNNTITNYTKESNSQSKNKKYKMSNILIYKKIISFFYKDNTKNRIITLVDYKIAEQIKKFPLLIRQNLDNIFETFFCANKDKIITEKKIYLNTTCINRKLIISKKEFFEQMISLFEKMNVKEKNKFYICRNEIDNITSERTCQTFHKTKKSDINCLNLKRINNKIIRNKDKDNSHKNIKTMITNYI